MRKAKKEERGKWGDKKNLSGWLTFPCKQTTNSEDEGATLTSKAQLPHRFTMSAYQPEILAKPRKKSIGKAIIKKKREKNHGYKKVKAKKKAQGRK